MKIIQSILGLLAFAAGIVQAPAQQKKDSLRVIVIFAHPDDADSRMGGTAILLARMGAAVKFVALTNGDCGHYAEGGGTLGMKRRREAFNAGKKYGIAAYKVLDNHDSELLPDLRTRQQVIREIREWKADVVIGLRPNDYHPDHRNAGSLVEDAAFMVTVPNVVTDAPALIKNPTFLYMQDKFRHPTLFSHDIVVGIDEVIKQKTAAMAEHTSQMFEWLPWIKYQGDLSSVPPASEPEKRLEWLQDVRGKTASFNTYSVKQDLMPPAQRAGLRKWYPKDKANQFQYAESFEIAEYGHQPTEAEIKAIFPMLGH